MLGGGSQSSFVAASLIDDLKLEVIREMEVTVCAFESQSAQLSKRRLVRFDMKVVWMHSAVVNTAYESTHALSAQPAVPQDVKTLAHACKLQLADPKTHSQEDLPVEILIRGDHYMEIVKDSPPIRILMSAELVPTAFGWILSGNRSGTHVKSAAANPFNLEENFTPSEDDFKRFWDLETIGISENHNRSLSVEDSKLIEVFQTSFHKEDQRRVVSLPRQHNIARPSKKMNAEKRLHNFAKRLENNAVLKQMYHNQS